MGIAIFFSVFRFTLTAVSIMAEFAAVYELFLGTVRIYDGDGEEDA